MYADAAALRAFETAGRVLGELASEAPRLQGLRASCPSFDVQMDVTDVMSERVLEESVTPVCSPGHLIEAGGLALAADLVRCTLLHEVGMLAD